MQQLKQLIVQQLEQLVELAEVFTDAATDIIADIAGKTELKIRVKIRQPKKLKVFNSLKLSIVLLLAICYQDSLMS